MAKNSWYAWRDADGNGDVCQTWDECQKACSGKSGEKHKGFKTYEEAWAFAHPDQPEPEQPTPVLTPAPATPAMVQAAIPTAQTTAPNTEPPWDPTGQISDNRAAISLDASKIEKPPVSEQVNKFCEQYDFKKLSEDQRRAVQAAEGKYLLFAVPGSGKTTVLMARTGYLIHGCGIPPEQLMTMTFTRASAKEMRDRYCKYFPTDESKIPDFRTIHSFCYSIVIPMLRKAGFICPHHVINEDAEEPAKRKKYTQRVILATVLKKHLSASKSNDETAQETVQTAFSSIKNREMTEAEYSCYMVKIDKAKYQLAPLFKDYQELLSQLDCMDFDDMLVYALKGLKECPSVLKALQERYHYWSIDEAQDNSKIQHELMILLAGSDGNLFMVGDDDQSIYGFRGAEPGMLLTFGNRPDVHLLVMGTNYRSDQCIVTTAKPFVEINKRRADKSMNASHPEPGEMLIPPSFPTEAQQYEYIDKVVRECVQSGTKLGILYQLNISALPLLVHMHRSRIPFEASKGLSELLHRKTAGNLMQIIRFSQHQCSMERFAECRKTLGLYWMTEELMKQLKDLHARNKQKPLLQIILESFEEENERSRTVSRLHRMLQNIQEMKPSDALICLLKSPDLAVSFDSLTDRLAYYALLSIFDLYSSIPEMLEELNAMEQSEKQKDEDIPAEEKNEEDQSVITAGKPLITLSTIHSAKGREWDRVILIDSFQETFPGQPQFDRIGYDPEEARRVFYVAATRAIHRLEILTVGQWHGNCEPVSSFIPEFAFLADLKTDESVTEKTIAEESVTSSSEYIFQPTVFYGVPVGRVPGVYTDYKEVEEQINNFSIPAGKQQKKFTSYEEAWEYTFPGIPIPEKESPLDIHSIQNVIQVSGGATFNRELDIPPEVRDALMERLGTGSLKALTPEKLFRLKTECDLFRKGRRTDYHGHTDGYAAVYMPVNFHKVWLPLWKILSENKLPLNARVLELGPGPGTASWSLIEFWRWLARDNPDRHFELKYTAVERETDFRPLFLSILERISKGLPHNMSLSMELISGTDAFTWISDRKQKDADIILESNLLNLAESAGDAEAGAFLTGLGQNLKTNGYAIMIEPGRQENVDFLNSIALMAEYGPVCETIAGASKAAIHLAGNQLVKQTMETGLRSRKMEHWFSYLILQRKEVAS